MSTKKPTLGLATLFDFSRLDHLKSEHEVNLLIELEAPKIELKNRPGLNLLVCLDTSPSMAGDKLEYVKRSMEKFITHLTPQDHLTVLTFDQTIDVMFETRLMDQDAKADAQARVAKLYTKGMTNFSGLLQRIFAQALPVGQEKVSVLILTDGNPTCGDTNRETLREFAKKSMKAHHRLATLGYGSDHDAAFLKDLAEYGKGTYTFVQNPEDALTAFAKELGGLLSCYAQDIETTVEIKDGVEIKQVLSDVTVEDLKDGGIKVKLPDLYSEEVRPLVVKLKLPKHDVMPREVTVADVTVRYTDVATGDKVRAEGKARVSFVKNGDVQKDPDQKVQAQVALLEAFKAQQQAFKFAAAGDFGSAQASLDALDLSKLSVDAKATVMRSRSAVSGQSAYASVGVYLSCTNDSSGVRGMSVSNSVQKGLMDDFATQVKKDDLSGNIIVNQPQTTLTPGQLTFTVPPQTTPKKDDEKKDGKKSLAKTRSGW